MALISQHKLVKPNLHLGGEVAADQVYLFKIEFISLYCRSKATLREKGRERFSNCWFTLQIPATAGTRLGQSQEPGTHSTRVAGTQRLGPFSVSPGHIHKSWKRRVAGTQTKHLIRDMGTVSVDLTYCATTLTLIKFILWKILCAAKLMFNSYEYELWACS